MAARSGDGAELLRMYAAEPLAINMADDHGFTALYHASLFGHVDALQLLLGWGADWKLLDKGGLSALHIACEKGHAAAAVCLLQHGADSTALDSIQRTPLDWAREKGHADVVDAIERWQAAPNDM